MFPTSSVGEVATGGKFNPMLLGAGYVTVNKKDASLCLYYKVTNTLHHTLLQKFNSIEEYFVSICLLDD